MHLEQRRQFQERVDRLSNVFATTFQSNLEALYDRAVGVVAMGGYNTFCEILSFNKPALLVPRTEPRQEQVIRAERAAKLGLVRVLLQDDRLPPVQWRLHCTPSATGRALVRPCARACSAASTGSLSSARRLSIRNGPGALLNNMAASIAVVVKGYPGSRSLHCQELLALEQAGGASHRLAAPPDRPGAASHS